MAVITYACASCRHKYFGLMMAIFLVDALLRVVCLRPTCVFCVANDDHFDYEKTTGCINL